MINTFGRGKGAFKKKDNCSAETPTTQPTSGSLSKFLADKENQLSHTLKKPVSVTFKANKTVVSIDFDSIVDFDEFTFHLKEFYKR
jgi:hypothetical protein